jgi:diguanylate cyclase (GGDEF)-like protein
MNIDGIETAVALPTPLWVDVLYETRRTRVSRLNLRGGSVIRTEPLGADRQERLRKEVAVRQRLAGVAGVLELLAPTATSLMLRDAPGTPLARRPLPLPYEYLVSLALDLAGVVGEVHSRGVMHRDINPANILLSEDAGAHLIDCGLATTAELHQGFRALDDVPGSELRYSAPEETGRTGRPVDRRCDLYALGVTLYELSTGVPPFQSDDPLQLIHDHLARVPTPPSGVNAQISVELSDIIMHLLEKEPDNRYQTAEGLRHDLTLLGLGPGLGKADAFRVAQADFPTRLRPPTRPVGRERELTMLRETLAGAVVDPCRGILISGRLGEGKTHLLSEFRSTAAADHAWSLAGRFDRNRRGRESDGIWQAFRDLGRQLLAEPEAELEGTRAALRQAMGPNAALMAGTHPEFSALLGVDGAPVPEDPLTLEAPLQRVRIDVLRTIACGERPLVLILDDLHWATKTSLAFIDAILNGEQSDGVLIVGAYRDDDDSATPAFGPAVEGWRRMEPGVRLLHLGGLTEQGVARLLAEMLRLDEPRSTALAAALLPLSKGNPSDTIELINSLRREGALKLGAGGWDWGGEALSIRLRPTDTATLLLQRVHSMPPRTRGLLEIMAYLGDGVDSQTLRAATALPSRTLDDGLAPALEDGLVVLEHEVYRFNDVRVQHVVLLQVEDARQRTARLCLARRLATRPQYFAAAAEQYRQVADRVHGGNERRRVVELLRRAAEQAQLLSDHALVEQYLATAIELIDPGEVAVVIEVQCARHAALYSLGRLDEADVLYRAIDQLSTDPLTRASAGQIQVSSLTNRGRQREAIRLGLDLLAGLGYTMPDADAVDTAIEDGIERLRHWVRRAHRRADQRPEITDPTMRAAGALISRIVPSAFFCDQTMMAWLVLEAVRIWIEHGPSPTLAGTFGAVGIVMIARRQDYRTGFHAMRRVLADSHERGYEPARSQLQFYNAVTESCWFEPLADTVPQAQSAREGLVRAGDMQTAGFAHLLTIPQLFDLAPSLDVFVTEVETALKFAARTGNDAAAERIRAYRQLAATLRSEGPGASTDQGRWPTTSAKELSRALATTILGGSTLPPRTGVAIRPDPELFLGYPAALAHLLRGLAIADEAHSSTTGMSRAQCAEIDTVVDWLAARADDNPANFRHLLRLLEAERAWGVGDFRAATHAFDLAQSEAAGRPSPWHRALINERAARFYLAYDMPHAGHAQLASARREYAAWGAQRKVEQLDWAYTTLHSARTAQVKSDPDSVDGRPERQSGGAASAIDVLGILAASQALSSETSIGGLEARVAQVLRQMTGATHVHLLLPDNDYSGWLPAATAFRTLGAGGVVDGPPMTAPMSVVQYARRTNESLIVADATRDSRFARDPYFADLACCSLLALPIFHRNRMRALLLLENRLFRGAFSGERLGGVKLIAGQLAVSLDNATMYASLERTVHERTTELRQANEQLERLSNTDSLTGLANRRRLGEVLEREWSRAVRAGLSIGFVMADIDHFKLFNDRYGHGAGDRCLQRVGELLQREVRRGDLVGRYGGEEFGIVMPTVDLTEATDVARRLAAGVASLAEPNDQVADGIVTLSAGVAALVPDQRESAEHMVALADSALYAAKRNGRNRVEAAPSGTSR